MATFIYALDGEPESLDCAKASSMRSERVCWLLFDTLIETTPDGAGLKPCLVEEVPDAKALTVSLRLRPGIRFHDGTPLDAAAVEQNVRRHIDSPSTKGAILRKLIKNITTLPPLGVTFDFNFPGLHYLAEIDIHSPTAIREAELAGKEYGSRNGGSPVGTGPFKLHSWLKDEIVLDKSPVTWRKASSIDQVVFRTSNPSDAHLIPAVREEGTKTHELKPKNVIYLGFNTVKPPFDDRNRRKAVVDAIAKPPLPPIPGFGWDLTANTDDSMPPSDSSSAVDLVFNGSETIFVELAAHAKKALASMMTVNFKSFKEFPALVSYLRNENDWDMFLYIWHVRAPNEERIYVPLLHPDAVKKTNLTRYALLGGELDSAMKTSVWSAVESGVASQAPLVILGHAKRFAKVSGVNNLVLREIDGHPVDKLVNVTLTKPAG